MPIVEKKWNGFLTAENAENAEHFWHGSRLRRNTRIARLINRRRPQTNADEKIYIALMSLSPDVYQLTRRDRLKDPWVAP